MKKVLSTIAMLACSNMFMNAAWYGHLKNKHTELFATILVSWGIAFFEYCLQVPANRLGSSVMSVTQLKVTQEVLSIGAFLVFSAIWLGNRFTLNQLASFGLIVVAAWLATRG